MDCIRYQLPCLLSQHPIGLVVIDSVASPFRVEDSNFENKDLLHTLGYKLHQLAETCTIAVVAINQVCSSSFFILTFLPNICAGARDTWMYNVSSLYILANDFKENKISLLYHRIHGHVFFFK